MEKKKYISYNQRIIGRLAELGFKRRGYITFIRKIDGDIIQTIDFAYTTHGHPHVKYYYFNVGIELPKAYKIAQKHGVYIGEWLMCNNLEELSEKEKRIEWLIGEDTDESYDNKMIDLMLQYIEELAIPFLNKYTTMSAIVEGIKTFSLPGRYGVEMMACTTLLLYGSTEDFIWFVKRRTFERQFGCIENDFHWDYKNPPNPLNKYCKEFLESAMKLKPIYEEKGITL